MVMMKIGTHNGMRMAHQGHEGGNSATQMTGSRTGTENTSKMKKMKGKKMKGMKVCLLARAPHALRSRLDLHPDPHP